MSGPNRGRRRIDRVLSETFTSDLDTVDSTTLLQRRDEALEEEANVSYVRRLLQGRLDLLRFEVDRRQSGGDSAAVTDDADLVRALASVLADKGSPKPRPSMTPGMRAVPLNDMAPPSVGGMSRRSAESAVADVRFSDLRSLSDEELHRAIAKFKELEHETSKTRTLVQKVADELAAEVESRVAKGALAASQA